MRLTLKKMRLINFKGVRQLEIDFEPSSTSIGGANGTGKTTLFDAFTWVLFGKDSKDRKQFDLKTLDQQGQAIPKLPHEVTLTLNADGREVVLTRRFVEKWVKRRGSATEEFKGHEEERLYNDVPCSAREWQEKVSSLCNESVFKFITSPSYFVSQKPEVQRAMLLRMAGGFSDNDVVAASGQREDFITLLGSLCGKTMEEYKREIASKKRIIKAELDSLPGRIDERQRDNADFEGLNEQEINKGIAEINSQIADIEAKMTDAQARVDAEIEAHKKRIDALQDAYGKCMQMEQDAFQKLNEKAMDVANRRCHIQSEMSIIEAHTNELREKMKMHQAKTDMLTQEREGLIKEYMSIKAMRLQFPADSFICPTCRRQLPLEDIEKKRAEMEMNHNEQIANMLAYNKDKGEKCSKSVLAARKEEHDAMGKRLNELVEKYSKLRTEIESLPYVERATNDDVVEYLADNAEYQALIKQCKDLAVQDSEQSASEDSKTLASQKAELNKKVDALKSDLEKCATLKRNNKRIEELTQQMRDQSEELARLEGIEFTMAEFSKVRNEAINAKVSKMFQLVRFKMYAQQINGGEVETCEAMVGGIPYSSLNNAMQINAGLDIINAICRYEGIYAPVFIDNAESVNEPLETSSQQIRLYVTNDKSLKIG